MVPTLYEEEDYAPLYGYRHMRNSIFTLHLYNILLSYRKSIAEKLVFLQIMKISSPAVPFA